MSRQLVRLADDVPVSLDWDAWRLRDIDAPKTLDLCRELGLRTLAGEIRDLTQSTGPAQPSLFPDGEELFPFGANAPAVGAATVRERDPVEEPPPAPLRSRLRLPMKPPRPRPCRGSRTIT